MKIKCWSCRRVVAETTDKYDPDRVLNGSMIRVAEPYRSRGWGLDMNWNVGTGRSELFCPECAYPLAPTKGLDFVYETDDAPLSEPMERIEAQAEPKYICDICGKAAKNAAGLAGHKRWAHPEAKND